MNWSTVQGNWNEAKGKLKTQWGRLTDDDLTQVQGHKDRLVGVIQQKYGIARDKAEEQLEEFLSSADSVAARAANGAQEVLDKGKEYLGRARDGAQEVVDRGRHYVEQGVEQGREYVQQGKQYVQNSSSSDMASDFKSLIMRNPIPSAILGLGIGYLLGRMFTSSDRS